MRRARLLPLLAASLMLPGAALADSEVEQLKRLVKRLEQRVAELEKHEARIDKGLASDTLSELSISNTKGLKERFRE